MSVSSFFNSYVSVIRMTEVDDGMGNWEEKPVEVLKRLHCCIQPRRGIEVIARGKEQSEITHVMYSLPTSPVILASDTVVKGEERFDILDIRDIDYLERFWTIDLKEIRED